MTTKRKTHLKRAAISWLCVAALAGGCVPTGLPGIIPAVTAAAEDVIAADHIINLAELTNYRSGTTVCPAGITASFGMDKQENVYDSVIELTITQSGTYKLTGSNLIGGSYFDVKIIAAEGVNANIVCEDAFIRNDAGTYMYTCGSHFQGYSIPGNDGGSTLFPVGFVVPFKAEADASITLSGRLAVDTFSSYDGYNYIVPVSEGAGTVNTDAFSVVTYKDTDGKVIDKGYYLSARADNPYSADHSEINISNLIPTNYGYAGTDDKKLLSDMFQCFSVNGMRFDPASITGDVTVECNTEHTGMEDSICDKCGYKLVIDLRELDKYISGELQTHGYITVMDTIGDEGSYTKLTINTSGAYKLTGSNTTDVKIYAPSGVTADIVCDNAYIKNTNGSYSIENEYDEYAPILFLEASGYICPFGTYDSGKINLSGKLVVDTYSVFNITWDEYRIGDFIAEVAKESYSVTGDFTPIDSYTNGKKDQAFYLNGALYDASDYAGDHLCISVRGNDVGDYTFTAGTDNISFISYNDDHRFDNDSDVCKDCGNTFERYNVTFNDGSETPATERVINGRTVSAPESDPTAPAGMKFTGWYSNAECTSKYDFANPVTGNITLYAGWEALPVKSVAVKTAPDTTSYIEGQKFDPDGLVIAVTYENGTLEVAYTDETKGDFTFSPALTEELTVDDEKVTITYGGKSADQDIAIAEKQLSSIAVKTAQTKTNYIEGDKFDPAGLVITLTYDNGKTEDVAYSDNTKNGFTFAPEVLTLNSAKVTITYGGKSVEQAVTVTNKSLASIAVKTAPTKTTYIEGETFDPTGLVITLTYDNGKTEDVAYSDSTKDGFTFAPEELSLNNAKVTITYGGKSAEQAVTVTSKSLTSIAVKTSPTKTSYIEGDKFDPAGLVITLTYDIGKTVDVAYSDSTKDGFAFAPETLTTSDKKVTITYGGKTVEQAVTVYSKSSGGSAGGSSGGSSGSSSGGGSSSTTTPTTTNPSIGGSSKSWSDVAADLAKLTNDSEATIQLNGSTTVSVDVIKSIADTGSNVKFVINSAYSWIVDGADITAPAAADLTFSKTTSTNSSDLRGIEGTQFRINKTGIPTSLEIAFKTAHTGKFANLYKSVDGKLVFVTCAKVGEDGKVILPDVIEKGDYVAMLCEFSDLKGDISNDGVMNASDASAVLKDIVGLEPGQNPLMADFNGDGMMNAMDASTILKRIVGLA